MNSWFGNVDLLYVRGIILYGKGECQHSNGCVERDKGNQNKDLVPSVLQ